MKPVIAIIGRPNVGKSTLFNRILRRRQAVVSEQSGVTRDRQYADAEWTGKSFIIVDTGGILEFPGKRMEQEIRRQAEMAIEQADRVIFLVDVKSGITPDDLAVADSLRRGGKSVFLAVNKADNREMELAAAEFARLGLGEPLPISALVGRGVGELLDRALEELPTETISGTDASIKIAVVGRPNVGKSSLVNAFLNEERHIVDEKPGTTRDSIDSKIKFYGAEITLIDTAGLRRPSKVNEEIEFYSNLRTTRALNRCDLALVLFDAPDNITKQDTRVINEAADLGKGIVLLANKWDLLEKETGTFEAFQKEAYFRIPNLAYIPLVTASALNKQRIHRVLQVALEVMNFCQLRVPTSELNQYILDIVRGTPPPAIEGRYIKIKYAAQVSVQPTTFTFHCNHPAYVAESYRRFLERKIREKYQFSGVPLQLKFLRK